jgi:hypothetical protein
LKKIHKYPLQRGTLRQSIYMPWGAQIVSVQAQKEVITIWAIIDDADEIHETTRDFWVIYTGSPIHEPKGGTKLYYLATVVMDTRGMVYHVFEEAPIIKEESDDTRNSSKR